MKKADIDKHALQKFLADLQSATEMYCLNKREGAATAVIATLKFLEGSKNDHLTAPWYEALDILRRKVEDSDVYRTKVADILDVPKSNLDWPLSKKEHTDKLIGCVAVEYQMLNGCKPEEAMRRVVGNDSAAAKSLRHFRHNIEYNDSPKKAWQLFQQMIEELREFPVSTMADFTIELYRDRIGTGVVKRTRFTKL
jgi:hypothetical protein